MLNEHTPERIRTAEDLEELEFSPLAPDEAAAFDDRIYLLGVHADRHRNIEGHLNHWAGQPTGASGL
jgi:hypothetical protein